MDKPMTVDLTALQKRVKSLEKQLKQAKAFTIHALVVERAKTAKYKLCCSKLMEFLNERK